MWYDRPVTEPIQPAGPPRRLTREEARQQTRTRLLNAAAEVFSRLGYNGASLDAVAEAAGYSKGAVYSNFATKADLFMALLERYVEAESAVQGAELAVVPIDRFIDGLGATFTRQTGGDPNWVPLQIEFWLAAVRDPTIRARYLTGAEELRTGTGETLDRVLADAGIVAPFTGTELGILLNALGTGLAIQFFLQPEALDPELLVRAARLLAGIDARPTH
jgi:AcrR family transcriptional regulator